ncbi:MAG: alpha/beta fold hydrolase [Nannocystaceae bacterium]
MSDIYPFGANYFDVGRHRMHYVDEGEGDPVLMVHGNPSWSFYYRNLIRDLSRDRRAVAPDHIGCGRSDKPRAADYNYTLASRVDDLERFVDHLGLERLTLVVHDWGGMIGMAWAVRHPQRVSKIVLLNTGAFHLPQGKRFPVALMLARLPGIGEVLVRGGNAFVRGAIRFCVRSKRMPPDVAAGYLEPYDSWKHRVAVHRFVQDIPLWPSDPAYAVVSETADALIRLADKPMLICWGMRDFVFDHHFLEEWETRFAGAEVHRYPRCGHYILEDAAEEIVPLVRAFIEKGEGAKKNEHAQASDDVERIVRTAGAEGAAGAEGVDEAAAADEVVST